MEILIGSDYYKTPKEKITNSILNIVDEKIKDVAVGQIDLSDYAKKSELPTKVSELENDKGYITSSVGGVPIVEELGLDNPIGTIVSCKQNVEISKLETITETQSIRDLKQGDVITKINFLIPEDIPSEFKSDNTFTGFYMFTDSERLVIMIEYSEGVSYVGWIKDSLPELLIADNQVNQENMKRFEDFINNHKTYYGGSGSESDLSSDEVFDFLDYFITVGITKEIKTTEQITKAIPHIKQEYGWAPLETTDKDFNNDFNFDFN